MDDKANPKAIMSIQLELNFGYYQIRTLPYNSGLN